MESDVNILAINSYQWSSYDHESKTESDKSLSNLVGESDDKYRFGAILFDSSGYQYQNFKLEYDDFIIVRESCQVVWKNELYIYGGLRLKKQILKLDQCKLTNTGKQLPTDVGFAGCTTTEDEIWLCFVKNDLEVISGSAISRFF